MIGKKYKKLLLNFIVINVANLLNFIFAVHTEAVS